MAGRKVQWLVLLEHGWVRVGVDKTQLSGENRNQLCKTNKEHRAETWSSGLRTHRDAGKGRWYGAGALESQRPPGVNRHGPGKMSQAWQGAAPQPLRAGSARCREVQGFQPAGVDAPVTVCGKNPNTILTLDNAEPTMSIIFKNY